MDTIDVFQLEQILQCPKTEFDSLINFTKMDHNDLFSVDFVYQDVNSSREYTKDALVNRLDQIDKPGNANWSDGSCTKRGDTLLVKDIEYIMNFNLQGEIRGQSDFTVVKKDNWQIVRWINYPSDGTKASLLTPIQE